MDPQELKKSTKHNAQCTAVYCVSTKTAMLVESTCVVLVVESFAQNCMFPFLLKPVIGYIRNS